ncbi:MAG: hypothetical protein AAF561_07895 [Planctomycetota bacterium]
MTLPPPAPFDRTDDADSPADLSSLVIPAVESDGVEDERETVLRQQASMILTAMDAAKTSRGQVPAMYERREGAVRVPIRQEAGLTLFADDGGVPHRMLFIRDVEPRAVGFITPERLPLGYGGTLHCRDLADEERRVAVTVIRCRSCYGGWFEGAAYFHKPQRSFGELVTELA